jgi:predicted RNA-binding protein with PIN domain
VADPLWIVDGDNAAHRLTPGAADHRQSRDKLVAQIAGYAAQAGIDVVVVFDGAGDGRSIGRTSVRYAGSVSADTVIERLAAQAQGGREVMVISSDNVLRHVAAKGGVEVMHAGELLARLSAGAPGDQSKSAPRQRFQLGDSLDPKVREALERLRRER